PSPMVAHALTKSFRWSVLQLLNITFPMSRC
ncbi:hypothetical protein KIPB_013647, partial [Kipferlia bialata]